MPERLLLGQEPVVERGFHLPRLPRAQVRGNVLRRGREAVGNAVVRAASTVRGHAGFETVADGRGRFSAEQWWDRMGVYASDPGGAEAGLAELRDEDDKVTVVIAPAATARGRVTDGEGQPRSNEVVFCRMRGSLGGGEQVVLQFKVRTDLMGAFSVPGLLVSCGCDVTVLRGHHPCADRVEFTVAGAGMVELPDLVLGAANWREGGATCDLAGGVARLGAGRDTGRAIVPTGVGGDKRISTRGTLRALGVTHLSR
ncbi:MAG: hypothetical protein JWO38_7161 [Gemmataceae bacterium]|nr:hypothetical protein [Gemmataceae bacterium]